MEIKKSVKSWVYEKKDWIIAEEINQEEMLTESEYAEAIKRWEQMGAAENYKHQDDRLDRTCKPYVEWCRCQQ